MAVRQRGATSPHFNNPLLQAADVAADVLHLTYALHLAIESLDNGFEKNGLLALQDAILVGATEVRDLLEHLLGKQVSEKQTENMP